MIDINHEALVAFSKSYGLIYLMLMAATALIYALWPANSDRFEHARKSIQNDEDGPCL